MYLCSSGRICKSCASCAVFPTRGYWIAVQHHSSFWILCGTRNTLLLRQQIGIRDSAHRNTVYVQFACRYKVTVTCLALHMCRLNKNRGASFDAPLYFFNCLLFGYYLKSCSLPKSGMNNSLTVSLVIPLFFSKMCAFPERMWNLPS